ncbi:hypothetical protein SUGI_0600600, partial [Cryptomeria japonica]
SNFRGVMRKKTTGEMSGLSYAIGLLNYIVYTWYASPLISNGWDNALVMAINAIGLLLQFCFCAIYLIFAPPKPKVPYLYYNVLQLSLQNKIDLAEEKEAKLVRKEEKKIKTAEKKEAKLARKEEKKIKTE